MEHPDEGQRLERKTSVSIVTSHLRIAGLRRGMKAVDVGCGTGAVTRVLSHRTRTCATGVDASAERLSIAAEMAQQQGANCRYVVGVSNDLPFASDAFDFVWSRFLFEYLPTPQVTLAEMVRIAKPRGIICVADLDDEVQNFYPKPQDIGEPLARGLDLLREVGYDPFVGRKLYGYFLEMRLANIRVVVKPYQTFVGGLPENALENWRMKLARATERLVAADHSTDWAQFSTRLLAHLQRKDLFYYSTLVIVTATK